MAFCLNNDNNPTLMIKGCISINLNTVLTILVTLLRKSAVVHPPPSTLQHHHGEKVNIENRQYD